MAEMRQTLDVREDGIGRKWIIVGILTDAGTRFEFPVEVPQAVTWAKELLHNVTQIVKDASQTKLEVAKTSDVLRVNGNGK